MNIYRLKPDTKYRLMYPEDKVYDSDLWEFKAQPLIEKLPLNFTGYFSKGSDVDYPKPDIAYLGMSTFALRGDVADTLAEDILEPAGELLPFTVDGELWYCLNVTECAPQDALDKSRSRYEIEKNGLQINLLQGAFNPEILPNTSLFKMPHDNYTDIYCANRQDLDEDVMGNFFAAVAAHGYTGLEFIEVYTDA